MTDNAMDAYLRQQEEEDRLLQIEVAKVEEYAKVWREKWPNACSICRGQGVFHSNGTYWEPPSADLCSRLESDETRKCCRCGQPEALDEHLNGPCKHCDWNFDDMEPSFW